MPAVFWIFLQYDVGESVWLWQKIENPPKPFHFSERENPINGPCPACKGKVQLKMSMGSFHLKGSGWYKDGYVKKTKVEER